MIPSNYNKDLAIFHHIFFELIIWKNEIYCSIYIPSIHCFTKPQRTTTDDKIYGEKFPWKYFPNQAVFSLWKSNIECWVFLPPLIGLID